MSLIASTAPTAVVPRPAANTVIKNVSTTTSPPAAPSPGRFQHPRMKEIAKRRAATSFTAQNVQTILLNAGLLIASLIGSDLIHPTLTKIVQTIALEHIPSPISIDASLILLLARLLALANILLALRPVLPYVRKSDQIEDIPLTPSQRALLGLLPTKSNALKTPVYVTPPRYMRSSPLVGSPQTEDRRSVSVNYTPQSTPRYSPGNSQQTASATPSRRISGSPYTSSPLFSKTFSKSTSQNNPQSSADFTESTRSLLAGRESFYSGGSLRRSQSIREPGTPSPSAKERTKVKLEPGLNYKWLYEKGLKVGKNGGIEY